MKSFFLAFATFAVAACNTLAGIEPGKLGLCADGSYIDETNCDGAGPPGTGENGGASSGGETHVSCDAPWKRGDPVTGRCYLQEYIPREWAQAEERCEELGGHLVAIDSAKELEHLADWIISDVWIGGTDAKHEGKFYWTNGQPWSFASWKDGAPSDPNGNRDCVMLATPNGSFPVYTCRSCTDEHPYICESSPNNP